MIHTLVQAWIAALIVMSGAVVAVAAIALFILGGIWVLDRIAERFGLEPDRAGSVAFVVIVLTMAAAAWIPTFYWLMGWA